MFSEQIQKNQRMRDRYRIEIGLKPISSSLIVETLPYFWIRETLSAILSREEYLGHTINLRTRTKIIQRQA